MKPIVTMPRLVLVDKDPKQVDKVIGTQRTGVQVDPIDWSQCGLRKRFPVWDDFMEELALARAEQKAGGRLAPPVAIRPSHRPAIVQVKDVPPWADGPSVAQVNKRYGTTDRGR